MSKEGGDGGAGEVLRKLKKLGGMERRSVKKKPATKPRLHKYMPCSPYYPARYYPLPPNRVPPQYIPAPPQTHIPCMSMYPQTVPYTRLRRKSHMPKREMKTGPVLTNVSKALLDFQRKRDKFLCYLSQLQHDLNRINLPSASKENLDINIPVKENTKKRRRILAKPKQKKPKERENDSELTLSKSQSKLRKQKTKEFLL